MTMNQLINPGGSAIPVPNYSRVIWHSRNVKMMVWIVDEDETIRWKMEKSLAHEKFQVRCFANIADFQNALTDRPPDVLICDIQTSSADVLPLIDRVRAKHPKLPVIMTTAHSDLDTAVAAYKSGAFEYLPKPFEIDDMCDLVIRASNSRGDATTPTPAVQTALIGKSPTMQNIYRAISRLSQSQAPVLITGEAGTGKELVASAIHCNSSRARKSFIVASISSIPKDMMESELFGYQRAAFGSDVMPRKGRFEQADGGTLFLGEIGDMPIDTQLRLLCFLQTGEFYRVGGGSPIKVDVRVIASTYQDLETLVEQGRFLKDLYYHLNVIRLRIAPLRERREDVAFLARYFLAKSAHEHNVEPKRLLRQVLDRLKVFNWPGNVRQLENTCRWLTVMAPGPEVHIRDLPPELRSGFEVADSAREFAAFSGTVPESESVNGVSAPVDKASLDWNCVLRQWAQAKLWDGETEVLSEASRIIERTLIEVALDQCKGQRVEAARRLGWDRNTLTRKIKALGITG